MAPLICNADLCTRRCARTHARMHARIVRGVRLSRRRRRRRRTSPCLEKEDRPIRVVFPRSQVQSRGKDTLPTFLSFLGRISPCSLVTPVITYRRVITARVPYLPPPLSLFLSLGSVDTIEMAVRTAREIEYLPRQDTRSRIHGAIAIRPPCDRDFSA